MEEKTTEILHEKIDISCLENKDKRDTYQQAVKENYMVKPDQNDPQQHWEHIISSRMSMGKEILREKTKTKKHEDKALEDLLKRQK